MNKGTVAVGIAILLIVAGAIALYFFVVRGPVAPVPFSPSTVEAPTTLGEELYEGAKNPLTGALQGANPAEKVNPIEDLYQNPFE